MRILNEFTYAAENNDCLISHSISGNISSKLGLIKFINNKKVTSIQPFQFPEVTLFINEASIIFPNILITKNNDLINTNNGFTSVELIDHNISDYPMIKKENNILIKKPKNEIEITKGVYLLAANNFSAFLLGEIPRLEKYKDFISKGYPIILHGECLPFHMELLNLFEIASDQIIKVPGNKLIIANQLIHATPTFFHNSVSYNAIRYLRSRLLAHINENNNKKYDKVYFSRSKLGLKSDRLIENEKDIELILEKNNFVIMYPEKLKVIDQLQVFNSANILISPFGATWANLVLRKNNAKSLILATKFSPEFATISHFLDQELFAMQLTPKKVKEGKNFSQSHNFYVTEKEKKIIKNFISLL